ncbi:DDT domain-containing protein [Histoplasma ohiense]|nr:DDT domain-containing protein [Histoplasma ohiense (nom. inval.)]
MVLFKRKPVQYLPRPTIEDDSEEVWVIPETNEVFTKYQQFLHRMNFYKQKRFICEITGHSSLTFFEALRSETDGSREVNSAFPEPLKEPVLRKVQFSTISRIDSLVDQVFEDFKQDFYPGERVTVLLTNGTRLQGIVREKARFPELMNQDGSIERRASSRYLVKLVSRPNEEALLDDEHLARDRKIFTKQMLRSFIRNTVTRESWTGAPWLVKPHIAHEYRIDTEVPKHLQYGNRVGGKKANVAAGKEEDESLFGFFYSKQRWPNLKSAGKGHKSKVSLRELAKARDDRYEEYQRALNENHSFAVSGDGTHDGDWQTLEDSANSFSVVIQNGPPPQPPPPPIKYPIEDLDIPPSHSDKLRPSLKFLTDDQHSEHLDMSPQEDNLLRGNIKMESVGPLLETWNTLNVYCQVLQLDSFTFDDFVEAMQFSSHDVTCELFVEVHCAVLKMLVNEEKDQDGAVQISLPALPDEESEEEEDDESGEEEAEEPEREPTPPRRTTRSSYAKAEAENLKHQLESRSRSGTAEVQVHRAADMFGEYGWIDRLRKRDFQKGGWELVMIGLLHRLSYRPRLRNPCDEILAHLAPLDREPTQNTAQEQYVTLDVNLRVRALQIICMLLLETKAIKNYLEECSIQMTEFRKEKIDYQRARKACLEEIRRLHEERKQLQPENPPSPVPELEELTDVKMTGLDDDSEAAADTDDEDAHAGRSLRRGADRAAERKRRQEEERERKEQAAKLPKGSKQYHRVLKKIEEEKAKVKSYEEQIAILDNDLREADCPRTRVLGKDRFWNRYYWFERNAMPFEGLPTSSTASANYANGRLWVQGPDDMEREGFIDLPQEENRKYIQRFKMTVRQRKELEEGPAGVSNAQEWGYYDDPESLDQLLSWLDARGVREVKLRKELQLYRDSIAKYMRNRTEYLGKNSEEKKSAELEEEGPAATTTMSTRMSRRTKSSGGEDLSSRYRYRCLKWKNGAALRENGHLHVEPARPTKKAKRSTAAATATAVAVDETKEREREREKEKEKEKEKESKPTNRHGKPLTRQGTRYQF